MGEQHVCERQCLDALAGPQRSTDSGALAARTARRDGEDIDGVDEVELSHRDSSRN